MKPGDTCYLITNDAAWTIVRSAVDRASANGRFINVNGYRGQSYIAGRDVFPSYAEARSAAMAKRDRRVQLVEQGKVKMRPDELAKLKALSWGPSQ